VESNQRVVYVTGVITKPSRSKEPLMDGLEDEFGRRLFDASPYDFDFTDYYHEEHGSPLVRTWHVFEELEDPGALRERKRWVMALEDRFRDEAGDRPFNVDVGYVSGSTFVLASRKNHSHRIALGGGIYAEATLRYEDGAWRESPNPYPEFTDEKQHQWLDRAREYWLESSP
jgi:hypothetical protein